MPFRLIFICVLLLTTAACAKRGTLEYADTSAANLSQEQIFVATTRAFIGEPNMYGVVRGGKTHLAQFNVSVPPNHKTGNVEWATKNSTALNSFMVQKSSQLSQPNFIAGIEQALTSRPKQDREIFVFVHGFNNNFAEGMYRQVQIAHDYDISAVSVNFSWSSSASVLGYLYDRNSVSVARNELENLLLQLAKTKVRKITLVAHSMGSLLLMEALQQVAISRSSIMREKIAAIILISPDIDVDVFRSQVMRIGSLPQPFIVFTSTNDRALRLSALVSRQPDRLGSIKDVDELGKLNVLVVDTTNIAGGDDLHHSTAITSPAAIKLIQNLPKHIKEMERNNRSEIHLLSALGNKTQR